MSTATRTSGPRLFRPVRLLVVVVVGVLVLAGIGRVTGLLHGLNPFAEHTADQSQPALLRSINDLHEYRAASGHYEVVVDLKTKSKLPAFVQGEERVFLGVGDVPAEVDFSRLGANGVKVSGDRRTVSLTVPEPTLATPQIDTKASHLVASSKGVMNRLADAIAGTSDSEQDLYQAATTKLAAAAAADQEVRARAETNTRTMLQGFLGSLGFRSVTVAFTPTPDGR